MIKTIDSLSYSNGLSHLPAAQKIRFALLLLVLSMVSHPATQAIIFLWMGLWTTLYAKTPLKIYVKTIGMASLFLVLTLPPLFFHGIPWGEKKDMIHPWIGLHLFHWYFYLSQEGWEKALSLLLRSLSSISCLFFLLFSTPFAETMGVMKKVKIPELVVDLMTVIYRFLFVLLESVEQVRLAQIARGGYSTYKDKFRDAPVLIGRLLTRTFQRYHQLEVGLSARGYTGDLQTLSFQNPKPSLSFRLLGIVGFLLLCFIEYWLRNGGPNVHIGI